ncbi:MAG: DNA gyrase inhibitor YacG, partial [Thermodesulfobacteriota bacterium]|nr:DNA gyrase inhibitor YacG [Thermodesulfobacteriota bacterium]
SCPSCGRRMESEGNPWRPFCSRECKNRDFLCWVDESYHIAGHDIEQEEDDAREP